MAMVMTGEVQLPASREVVYAKLNDAGVLKACIPGCEELNKISDTELQAVAVTKIGPVKARAAAGLASLGAAAVVTVRFSPV